MEVKKMKKQVLQIFTLMVLIGGFSMVSNADTVKIGCKKKSNKVAPNPFAPDQTAVCSDCTDVAPSTHAYFKGNETRITHKEGHHKSVKCTLTYHDPFTFQTKFTVPGVGEQTVDVQVFRKVCVHGEAKATHTGETARIDCKAQVTRARIK
jgi:hypothetical protein